MERIESPVIVPLERLYRMHLTVYLVVICFLKYLKCTDAAFLQFSQIRDTHRRRVDIDTPYFAYSAAHFVVYSIDCLHTVNDVVSRRFWMFAEYDDQPLVSYF